MWTFVFVVAALFTLALLWGCWEVASWQREDLPGFAAFALLFVIVTVYCASRAFW